MSIVGPKREIIVDGKAWRAEEYIEKTCTEVVIRGPWATAQTAWKPNGQPRWFTGHYTAFKVVGSKAMDVNLKKSRKWKRGDPDPENMPDWKPFYEAWLEVRG